MVAQHLMRSVNTDDGLMVLARWRRLPDLDTTESIKTIYKDVPDHFTKLLHCKNTPGRLAKMARRKLNL